MFGCPQKTVTADLLDLPKSDTMPTSPLLGINVAFVMLVSRTQRGLFLSVFTVFDTLTTGFHTCFARRILTCVFFALCQTLATSIRTLAHDCGCASTGLAVAGALYALSIAGNASTQTRQSRWIFCHCHSARINTFQARISTCPARFVRVLFRLGTRNLS